jgi:hypothetical protein
MITPKIKQLLIILATLLIGCGSPRALLNVSVNTKEITREDFLKKIKGVLITNGYEVKEENKEAGFITTNFNKNWSFKSGDNEETTLRLQIGANYIQSPDGKIQISLTPIVKEKVVESKSFSFWNVFTAVIDLVGSLISGKGEDLGVDGVLVWYDEDDRDTESFALRKPETIPRTKMLLSFLKVSDEITVALGLTKDQVKLNISK